MAKSPIRKTLEILLKKVEALENQSFAQKLLLDELENKLSAAEEIIKKMKEDPLGLGSVTVASQWPVSTPQPYYPIKTHTCVPVTDWTGTYCAGCGTYMSPGPTYTVTSTSDSVQVATTPDTESMLDLDISWIIPDEPK